MRTKKFTLVLYNTLQTRFKPLYNIIGRNFLYKLHEVFDALLKPINQFRSKERTIPSNEDLGKSILF